MLKITETQNNALLMLLWDYMKPEKIERGQKRRTCGNERVQTGYGTKTREGLVLCINRIIFGDGGPDAA